MIECNPIHEVCNYASSAQYCSCPAPEQIRCGVIPLDSLPAAWWNWMWADTNRAVNEAREAVGILINEIDSVLTQAGVTVNPSCIDQLYQSIDKIHQRIGNAITAGSVKSSSCGGQVTIENDGTMTMNAVGNAANLNTTSKQVVGAINELKSTYDCCISDLSGCISGVSNSKAPTQHASSDTTYGVGSASCYGHLKISDAYTCCVGSAADGVAASQKALYCVYSAIQEAASLGSTAACPLGGLTGSAGTCVTAARSDHIHPSQYVQNGWCFRALRCSNACCTIYYRGWIINCNPFDVQLLTLPNTLAEVPLYTGWQMTGAIGIIVNSLANATSNTCIRCLRELWGGNINCAPNTLVEHIVVPACCCLSLSTGYVVTAVCVACMGAGGTYGPFPGMRTGRVAAY